MWGDVMWGDAGDVVWGDVGYEESCSESWFVFWSLACSASINSTVLLCSADSSLHLQHTHTHCDKPHPYTETHQTSQYYSH